MNEDVLVRTLRSGLCFNSVFADFASFIRTSALTFQHLNFSVLLFKIQFSTLKLIRIISPAVMCVFCSVKPAGLERENIFSFDETFRQNKNFRQNRNCEIMKQNKFTGVFQLSWFYLPAQTQEPVEYQQAHCVILSIIKINTGIFNLFNSLLWVGTLPVFWAQFGFSFRLFWTIVVGPQTKPFMESPVWIFKCWSTCRERAQLVWRLKVKKGPQQGLKWTHAKLQMWVDILFVEWISEDSLQHGG